MVQNIDKNSFPCVKNRKNDIPVIKITFSLQNPPRITGFHELTPKLLSKLAGLMFHSCGV